MIAEEVNKKGGINGHPIELIIADDESDTTKCNLAVKKLIKKDEVPVIIGPPEAVRAGRGECGGGGSRSAHLLRTSYKIVTPIESRQWSSRWRPPTPTWWESSMTT